LIFFIGSCFLFIGGFLLDFFFLGCGIIDFFLGCKSYLDFFDLWFIIFSVFHDDFVLLFG